MLVGFLAVTAPTVAASSCQPNAERKIVDTILNQSGINHTEIEAEIANLDVSSALVPEPDFYRALATWYQGYQSESTSQKRKGIKKLRQVAQAAEQKYSQDTARNHLVVGLVKAYTARALFQNEQIVKGYYMGIDAITRLEKFLAVADNNTPGYQDALFLMSLYSVYTHDLKTRSHWLIGTIDSVGNKAESVRHILEVIQSDAVFAAESARSFLAEVHWRTPEICRFRDLAENTHHLLPNNLDIALLAQGLLLKCGHPDAAWQINNRFHSRSELLPAVRTKIWKARLRILADQGKLKQISGLELPSELEPYQQLAKANAADVASSRTIAVENYRSILGNDQTSEKIKRAASVRLEYPYRAPKQLSAPGGLSGLKLCASQ